MLEVRDLHSFYGDAHVLHGATLKVAEGEVVALLGRNGMGKTTLISSIMRLPRRRRAARDRQPPIAIKDKLASRIKVISRLDISEKRVPQDGRMKLKFGTDRVIDFRVSTLPTLFGEKIVIRILDPSSAKARHRGARLRADEKDRLLTAIAAALRHGAGDRPDRLGQDGVALHLPEHPEPAGREHLHGRRPGGNQPARRQPGQRQRQGRPDLRGRAQVLPAPGSRTSSWSAKSATSRPPTSPSRRRRPATWCCRRCTPTTRRRR